MSLETTNDDVRARVNESASFKTTIESESVPDFLALAEAFRRDQDFAVWKDLTQRGDKALRRKLFLMGREFIPVARSYRTEFVKVCKLLHIRGTNIELMAVRFLFGTALEKSLVHDWSYVGRYWYECSKEQDIEKAVEKRISDLITEYREILKARKAEATAAASVSGAGEGVSAVESEAKQVKSENVWDFASMELTDFEPNFVIAPPELDEETDEKVVAYFSLRFRDGQQHFYEVPLSEKGIRELIGLVMAADKNTTTRRASWSDVPRQLQDAAE
jgi:hypothetical protein